MLDQQRRQFVKLTGGLIGTGAVLSANGAVTAETTQEDVPPLRGPYADEPWVEYRSDPGNTAAVSAAPDFDPDAVEASVLYDGAYISNQPAIVGDTMYVAGGGHVRALDAHDGSVRWTSEAVGASSTPAAAYERIVATGGDALVALDVEDGTLDWETPLDGVVSTPTVAYETVYVVADGTLYALDVTDGSIRWERRPEADAATFLKRPPAASNGQVYAIVDSEEGDNEIVAFDAGTGDRRWRDRMHYLSTPAATEEHVAAATGPGSERFRAVDATSGERVLEGEAVTVPALDSEVALTILDWQVEATFFDEREGWELNNFSTGALGVPTIAGDTVYVYVGNDHRETYDYSLLAIDEYTGEVEWTVDVPASEEGLGVSVVATGDAVYVFDQDAIYVVQEPDGSGGEDGSDGDDPSTPEDDPSTPEDDPSTPEDGTTPTDSPDDGTTPTDSPDDGCGCPDASSDDHSTPGGAETSTDSVTATDGDTASGRSGGSTDEDRQPVEDATSTEGDGAGLGVATAVGSLGGIGLVLHRRVFGGESERER
jgi:outer membrane protein assembly factor BamB